MGPQKSLSNMAEEVRGQTAEVLSFVTRLREANRRLTGSTGESPTQLGGSGRSEAGQIEDRRPLLVEMTTALEHLNAATADLRDEVSYLEGVSETGAPMNTKEAYVTQGIGAATGRY